MKVHATFNNLPMIRISNKKLLDCGFGCGEDYKILYLKNKLVILKVVAVMKNILNQQKFP